MFKFRRFRNLFIAAAVTLPLLVSSTANAASYSVASGDSLYTIGKLFNTSVSTIMNNNSLSSSLIYPGQVLNINASVYTVKSGDSLWLIAKNYGISVYSLMKANNEWDARIYPGQRLLLPGITTAQTQAQVTRGVIPYTASDVELLARLITAEAESEPYSAKVAVGAVVVNRVQDSRFPDTISTVIYEKSYGYYQFTPVENGFINRPALEDAKKAAYEALQGNDPTNGAVFYFDDSTTSKWMWSRPISIRIGRMVYTY